MYELAAADARQLGHLLGQEGEQVVDADDAGERAQAVDHGHAADAVDTHAFDDVVDVVVFAGGEQLRAHDVAHQQAGGVEAQGDDGNDDVAVGEDADGDALAVRLFGHDQVAHVVLAHQQRRVSARWCHAGNGWSARCRCRRYACRHSV